MWKIETSGNLTSKTRCPTPNSLEKGEGGEEEEDRNYVMLLKNKKYYFI